MKKILIPLILIFLIAAIGAVYFATELTKGKQGKNNNQENKTQAITNKDSEKFNSLLSQKNKACLIKTDKESGTIKISDGYMLAKTKNSLTDKVYNTLIIGDTMYNWEQGKSNGAKITKDENKPKIHEEFVNTIKPYLNSEDMECTPTKLDPEEFNVPKNIRFIDINALMGGNSNL